MLANHYFDKMKEKFMDVRTGHFHRVVGYLENEYRKIRILNRIMMVIRRGLIRIIIILIMMVVIITRHYEGIIM